MVELLCFIMGIIVGGLTMTVVMIFFHINKFKDLESKYYLLQEKMPIEKYED